jgi:transposase
MLGKRSPQGRLFATSTLLDEKQLDALGVHGRIAREGHRIFRDEDFAPLYCADNGRPSAPPSLLALATLLQFYDQVSDAEAVDRCRDDLRWKAALHLETHDLQAPFAKSTFQAFRSRLILHEAEGQIFETSVRLAREAGLLPRKLLVALDSSPVRGRGAIKDTFNLLSDAIKNVLGRVAEEQGRTAADLAAEAGLARHVQADSIKGSVVLDWSNVEERRRFLAELLRDCGVVLDLARGANCEGEETQLLEQVIHQDVEQPGGTGDQESGTGGEEDLPDIRQGVEKERMPSVTDPEMRHGRKSSGATYNGHKAHVAVTQSGVVTDVDVTAPSEPEGSKVLEAVTRTREVTGCEVDEVLGDSAYGTGRAVEQARECDVEIHSKMPSAPAGRFGPGDFEVSEDRLTARCPAGHQSSTRHRSAGDYLHLWDEELCRACPLRERCTTSKRRGRTLRAPPYFHDRRARERYARSPEGKLHLRLRVVVEHAIGRLKKLGAGRARYFGRLKTRYQWLMTAAVANLSLAWAMGAASATS